MIATSRHTTHIIIDDSDKFKSQVLNWANENFVTVCYFDNNHYKDYSHSSYEGLIAAGAKSKLQLKYGNAFDSLKSFYENKKDWLFGFLGYDLKNEIENLRSKNYDGLNFPDLFFFQPEVVIEIFERHAIIHSFDSGINVRVISEGRAIAQHRDLFGKPSPGRSIQLFSRISKSEYLQTVRKIKHHIQRGDIYEMNFCQEFYSENAEINPLYTFGELNKLSKAPFSCYLKFDGNYLISASPERFLKKQGRKLISMPIKGTARRGSNREEDVQLRDKLLNDQKERSENVMIVDLVRNDLSRNCVEGSVKVEELFGIKTFPQVHQMVSTITGTLRNDVHPIEVNRNAFPMGSMTGAPKIRAMELIEEQEKSKRGLYSGAVGYITPDGDFDFNVVIRSLLYNSFNQYLSFHVGSAIVADSVPEKEYEECLLKTKALREVLKWSVDGRLSGFATLQETPNFKL